MNPNLRCEVDPNGRSVRVRLVGELDIATVGAFSDKCDALLADGYEHLVLDLRDLTFMDSSGLRAIVKLHRDAPGLQIIDGPEPVQRVFTVTGLRRHLPFADPLGDHVA